VLHYRPNLTQTQQIQGLIYTIQTGHLGQHPCVLAVKDTNWQSLTKFFPSFCFNLSVLSFQTVLDIYRWEAVLKTIAKIRRYHFVEGRKIMQISKGLNIYRNSVRKVIRSREAEHRN